MNFNIRHRTEAVPESTHSTGLQNYHNIEWYTHDLLQHLNGELTAEKTVFRWCAGEA